MLATPELIAAAAQCDRLATLLPRYRSQTPLYGGSGAEEAQFSEFGLGVLPFITKEDIRRDFPRNFLCPELDLEELVEQELVELEHTSGTSEQRTPLLLPRGWWPAQERRALELNLTVANFFAEKPSLRRVAITSPVCSGEICYTGVPSRSDRTLGDALHLSLSRFPFLWGEAELERMAKEAADWEPDFLDVDPVYGVVFALYCERNGIRLPSLKFIICSYEFLSVVHRRVLQRVFRVPVFNLYGSTETGHLLMEGQDGLMRASLETAYLEVLKADSVGVGELVVTTLTNDFMPLIRYRIGDLVERMEDTRGSRYVVHGRKADAFKLANAGRATTLHVDRCFEAVEGIAHYQLVERDSGPWLLRYVPDCSAPNPQTLEILHNALRATLALEQPVELCSTNAVMPENSGKFRLGYPLSKPGVSL